MWESGPIPADVWGSECDGKPEEGLADTMLSHVELMADLVTQKYALPQVQVNGDVLSVASPD